MANVVTQATTTLMPEDVISRAVFFFSTKSWRSTSQSERSATFEGKPMIPKLGRCPNLVVNATTITAGTEVVVQHPKDVAGLVALFLGALPLTAQASPSRLGTMDAAGLTTPQFSPAVAVKASPRPISRGVMAIVAVVIVIAATAYWWLNRHSGQYKVDNSNLYPITVNGKSGFMDQSGKTVIAPQFDGVAGFSEGLSQVRVGTKFGYINTKGMLVITPQFDSGDRFQYGRARVTLGKQFGLIDKDGKYIATPNFMWAGRFSEDLAPVKIATGSLAFVNRSGKIVISEPFQMLSDAGFTEGLAPARIFGKWGFIDKTGKWIIQPQFEGADNFAEGMAAVAVGRRAGYIDKNGKFAVNPQYDSGADFSEGLAAVVTGGRVGFIDTTGRMMIDPQFMTGGPFSDGLSRVQSEDGWWGFIDRTGKFVVNSEFDSAEAFQNGLAQVKAFGMEAYVNTAGKFVVDPFAGTTGLAERARTISENARRMHK